MDITDLYWFLGTFLVVYLFYYFYQIFRKKTYNPKKVPVELAFLIKKYKLDMDNINYQSIMKKIGLASAFNIAFTATFVFAFIKNIYLAILIGAVMLVPLIFITFNFIGIYYRKKGLIK